jgi:hypothetical protein
MGLTVIASRSPTIASRPCKISSKSTIGSKYIYTSFIPQASNALGHYFSILKHYYKNNTELVSINRKKKQSASKD